MSRTGLILIKSTVSLIQKLSQVKNRGGDLHYLFLNLGQPFSVIFGLSKQTLQFFQQIYVKKCPSIIWCQDLNPQPSECESLPITTRPGLPPQTVIIMAMMIKYSIFKTVVSTINDYLSQKVALPRASFYCGCLTAELKSQCYFGRR